MDLTQFNSIQTRFNPKENWNKNDHFFALLQKIKKSQI